MQTLLIKNNCMFRIVAIGSKVEWNNAYKSLEGFWHVPSLSLKAFQYCKE